MIITELKKSLADAELRRLVRRLNNTLPFYKTWSTVVVNKARGNARSKGGKTLWKRIEKATQISSCNASVVRASQQKASKQSKPNSYCIVKRFAQSAP